ncbi:hypothetical protein KI387_009049, partial [Taxus chinensis]
RIETLPNENDYEAHKSQRKTLSELCGTAVPHFILQRAEEVGFVVPTDVQEQALPVVLSGLDCIIHSQTGSGKTLAYLLAIFAAIDAHRTAVQALIVVPTRELGMQVTKVVRVLAASYPKNAGPRNKGSVNVMALLDGGTLRRQKIWLKAEAPQIMVATLSCLCQLLEKESLKPDAIKVLVIDEVDSIFGAAKQTYLLRKLLTSYTSINNRQTIFASASIPQHRQFIDNCIQQKWTKRDVVHVHVHPIEPMPSRLSHRYVTYQKNEKLDILVSLLQVDMPKSGIIFVNEQSEKSKKAGLPPTTNAVTEHLRQFYSKQCGKSYDSEILLLEENMNFNARTASLSEVRQGRHILVATDIAARGLDLPETSHIYNFDLPKSATDYLHRAGRTGRKPFSDEKSMVTNLITTNERFVLERMENELSFICQELTL